jgi:uncharacterized protein YndB with AHSA1/START domain
VTTPDDTPDVLHRFETELVVPGTPEQVWDAIATAAGITAWMMPTELDAREGGALTFHMGPDSVSEGHVTAFEPSRRFAYAEDWATLAGHADADVTPLVTEFLVEARAGGTCVVRIVTSAFGTGADWEGEFFEEMGRGWAPMLDNLRVYLTHFAGWPVTTMGAFAPFACTPEAAVAAVCDDLGAVAVGDAVERHGVAAIVERIVPRNVLLRVASPVPGMLSIYSYGGDDGGGLVLHGYLFDDPDTVPERAQTYVEAEQQRWQAWLDDVATRASARANTR